ncbi:MAG: beta-galactosidase, partial [Anaerolineales bacterium]|nr:beta-galactosidase [Anaerolineales bacterium]
MGQKRDTLSVFVGLWLGLTAAAGLCTFILLYWATSGGFDSGAAVPTRPLAIVTKQSIAPATHPAPPASPACNWLPLPASGFGYGIQVHALMPGSDNNYWMTMVRDKLGLHWVKLQVRWSFMEPQPGQIDWSLLDSAIDAACGNGLRIMLSVIAAPEWTRANPLPVELGEAPPDDYRLYADFVGKIIDRYPGKIAAIEVWNEANLEREWNVPAGVNAADFARLQQ